MNTSEEMKSEWRFVLRQVFYFVRVFLAYYMYFMNTSFLTL